MPKPSTLALLLAVATILQTGVAQAANSPVTVSEDDSAFTLANGLLTARVAKRSGVLVSLKYEGLEMMAQGRGGANGGYWSSVGRGLPGSQHAATIRVDPATNGGARAEISCRLHNDPQSAAV